MKHNTYDNQKYYYNSILKRSNIEFNPYGYRRIPLYNFTNVEILLLEWNPNSYSPIHDHHDKGCIMFLLKNELLEKKYCIHTQNLLNTQTLPLNEFQFIDNQKHIHSIHNTSDNTTSLSLHIYPK